MVSCQSHQIPSTVQYVLDGGALLHRIPWPRGVTYSTVTKIYSDYVCRKYGAAIVVFDGYEDGPTTKDVTHMKTRENSGSGNIFFQPNMVVPNNKQVVLGNRQNKQRFINMLGLHLAKDGCTVCNAEGDADTLVIVKSPQNHL